MINSNDLNVDLFQIKNNDFDNEFIWGLSETTFQIEEPSKDYLNNVRICDGFSLKNNESGPFHLNYKESIV